MLREFYELRELTNVVWLPSGQNPDDSMRKDNLSSALRKIIRENRLDVMHKSWVERHSNTLPTWTN